MSRGEARVRTAPQAAWLINPFPSISSSILPGVPAEEPTRTLMSWVGMCVCGGGLLGTLGAQKSSQSERRQVPNASPSRLCRGDFHP